MRRAWIVWFATSALLLAACGAEEQPDAAEESPADDTTEEAEDEEELDIPPTVTTADTDFGEVLVDPDEGYSLYLFENDEDGVSTCYDDCAETWPPFITPIAPFSHEPEMLELLGTHTRDEGSSQVTYNGWPLYHYSGDEEPGDTSGQGVGGVWWLVDPDGEPIRDGAMSSAATPEPANG